MAPVRPVEWLPGVVLVAALATPFVGGGDEAPSPTATATAERPRRAPTSNIHRGDYVGPSACRGCHEEKHAAWSAHPHSRMNQDASPEAVLGDFSGVRVDYGDGYARFDRSGDAFFVTLVQGGARRRYRVTRTVGSRFTQMYVGVLVEGPEPPGDPAYRTEGKLPFGYWLRLERWLPEVYFDSDTPPEYRPDGTFALPVTGTHTRATWTENCIYCHNTYPYEERLLAGRGATGFPAGDLTLTERPERPAGGVPGLDPDRLVTLGISCESCHFGQREHAVLGADPAFLPVSPALEFPKATPERIAGAREDPYVVNGICRQCHFSRGVSPYPNGAGTWNAREAVDLDLGACAGRAKCTDCHDPHVASPPGGGPDRALHLAACLDCHPAYAEPDAQAAHARHDPAAVSCLDCHMPRIVQGLEAVVRTHHISAPGDPRMLGAGAPNACNLCHLDRSLRWTLDALAVGWGVERTPAPGWAAAYGGLDRPVGEAWLASDAPIVRLVAADAWSRAAPSRALPRLLPALDDPVAVNRMFALFAVERALGRRLTREEYDPLLPPAGRHRQLDALDAALFGPSPPPGPR